MKTKKTRIIITYIVFFTLLLGAILLSLYIGSVSIDPRQVFSVLTGHGTDAKTMQIILSIRLPRVLAAAILGGALAVSGFLLQIFFRNPIAGPFVLGISSGAKLVCCTCDDRRCLTWYYNEFVVYDRDGIDRIAPFDAFRIGGIKEGAGNVYAGCMWRDDRLYLFGNHGYCCDLCR